MAQPGWHRVPWQESQSVAAGMAAKSCGASPGGISSGVFGVLAGCRKGRHPLLQGASPTPWGFSAGATGISWSWEAKGTGAVAAATPWEGAIGGGKVTMALAATWQGQMNLTTKEGSGVGSPCPAPGAPGSVTQQRVAVPCWDTEPSPGSQARGSAAPGCPWKLLLLCQGDEGDAEGAGGAIQAVCATPCGALGDRLALFWHGGCRTAGPQAHPSQGCLQCQEQPLISGR